MAHHISIICARCGVTFRCFRPQQRFCSTQCYLSDRHGREIIARPNSKIEVICQGCGTVFLDWGSQGRQFCSSRCRGLAQQNRVSLSCELCGKSFTRPASMAHSRWCSRPCYYAAKDASYTERFWANVDRTDPAGCWPWIGPARRQGYGVFGKPARMAHRIAWALDRGRDIPTGGIIMHLCDNPICVRPEHLRLGTHADNIADKVAKGRHRQIAPSPSISFQMDLIPDHGF
jgi:endogenous inhibitor of DNA gyrase (YacG/DUF329 family)